MIQQFRWELNSEGTYCCPGSLDIPQGQSSDAYCCVGAGTSKDEPRHTTQPSCSTTVKVFPQTGYTSKVKEAATKYGVTYTTSMVEGNATVYSTATVGTSSTTGGAGARVTMGAAATGILVVAGGLLLNA